MRYTYNIPAADSVSFQTAFAHDVRKKIMPGWLREVLGVVLLAAYFGAVLWFTEAIDRAIALTCLVWLIHWSWQKGFAFLHRRMAARYIASLQDSELWVSEVSEDRFITENRGLRYSFPLSALSRVYEEKEYIYLEFSALGRARVPFSVFQSVSERCQFVRMIEGKNRPNQSPEPTTMSVTPPAAQERANVT